MTWFDLNKLNKALYKMNDCPEYQEIAESAFKQMHRFSNEHLHVKGVSATSKKSEILSTIIDDMSNEILNEQD